MTPFTLFHVALSLVGIAAGFVVIWGFLTARWLRAWTAIFLGATILTSLSGFLFPIERFTPAHAAGIFSLMALSVAVVARYPKGLAGRWRTAYVVAAMISQYFNFAVLIIQSFQKVPSLEALASTSAEPVTQFAFLLLFVALTVVSGMRFRLGALGEHQPSFAASR